MLQILVHLVCHIELMPKVCHSDRLLLVIYVFHRLLYSELRNADEVLRHR